MTSQPPSLRSTFRRLCPTSPIAVALPLLGALGLAACFMPVEPSQAAKVEASEQDDLRPEEKRLVDTFRDVSQSVVFVANNALMRRERDYFSRNVEEVMVGSGSGFVWDKEGHIVTNFHVVHNASTITVTLADQSVHRARRVGTYADKEVAVIKVDDVAPENLHPIRLGRSSDLQVGQTAIAIGNPFGLDHTLTVGVISALGREIQALTQRTIADVIQTDAAINPGNSGGPLLDSHGRLIGMNTAILSPSGVSAGIGFAVPVDTIRRYVDQIIRSGGKVSGAGLGIEPVPDSWTKANRIRGCLIRALDPKGAAAKGGLRGTVVERTGEVQQLGDVIKAIDEKPVSDLNTLRDVLEKYAVGDVVNVTFERDGKQQKTKVKLQQIELPTLDE